MLAAIFEGNGNLILRERPKPRIKEDTDVLLKVTGVGICGTDLHILDVPQVQPAKIGISLGHEFAGEVAEVGSKVRDFRPGDTVVVKPFPGCGRCRQCKRGRPDACESLCDNPIAPGHPQTIGIYSDGGMAEYVVVPDSALYKISRDVPYYLAALAEPLADVMSAVEKVCVQPGDVVVVLGAGPIGLLFTLLLKGNASKVIVVDISEERRKKAYECGATVTVDPLNEDLKEVIRRETEDGADLVVEAVGHLLDQAIRIVRKGGEILQFGHDENACPAIPISEIVRKEIIIRGSFLTRFCFEKAVKLLESGRLPLENVVSHRLPLSKVHEGVQLMQQKQALKVVLYPEE